MKIRGAALISRLLAMIGITWPKHPPATIQGDGGPGEEQK